MKQFAFSLILALFSYCSFAQTIIGKWNGVLDIPGMQLRIVFHITQDETGYHATMDSPDQGVKDIPATSTTFENNVLTISVESIGLTYTGEPASERKIVGSFEQGNIELPLDLSRDIVERKVIQRPQEPKKPFPYYSEDVTFPNKKAGIELAGTLTLPKKQGKYPVVILISGSGPQNRNHELMGHKPFLVLSDFLTRNGIAVLRYDDRGTAESSGDFSTATSHDFSTDVDAAIQYLKKRKEIDNQQIGLIGHSEGGMIAPMVASRNKRVAFIVLLAGTGIPGDQLLLLQEQLISEASRLDEDEIRQAISLKKGLFNIIKQNENVENLRSELSEFLEESLENIPENHPSTAFSDEAYSDFLIETFTSPWMLYFIKHDPSENLEKVKCPVLALNGSNDLQVPPNENLSAIKRSLENAGNTDFTIKELPNLNHLFQECETGAPAEYPIIEQTFSPIAMQEILEWIHQRVQ